MSIAVIKDVASALEAAVTALFALFGVFAFIRARNGAPALYFLATAAGLIALMLSGNFLAAEFSGLAWLNTVNIALELLTLASIYLYIRQARRGAAPIRWATAAFAAPAAAGMALRYVAIDWVDPFIIVVSVGFLAASFERIIRYRSAYSQDFIQFALPLLAVFAVVLAFRTMMAADPALTRGYRSIPEYVLLLGAVLAAASFVLFTALTKPNIVSASPPVPKYARGRTVSNERLVLKEELSAVLTSEKPYLNPQLTLEELAQRVGVNPREVSQLINSEYGVNFSAYMNALRIGFAQQLLMRVPADTPIKAVMYDSGFRSKSVFNREFLRNSGVTPSRFREQAASAATSSSAP